jgi:hypothetical protein
LWYKSAPKLSGRPMEKDISLYISMTQHWLIPSGKKRLLTSQGSIGTCIQVRKHKGYRHSTHHQVLDSAFSNSGSFSQPEDGSRLMPIDRAIRTAVPMCKYAPILSVNPDAGWLDSQKSTYSGGSVRFDILWPSFVQSVSIDTCKRTF